MSAVRSWQVIRLRHCHHVDKEVGLEAEVVYPAEWMPEQAPRVLGHRCSEACNCILDERPSCVWAGNNPLYDPFKEAAD